MESIRGVFFRGSGDCFRKFHHPKLVPRNRTHGRTVPDRNFLRGLPVGRWGPYLKIFDGLGWVGFRAFESVINDRWKICLDNYPVEV